VRVGRRKLQFLPLEAYTAERAMAKASCPSVRPSVTLRFRGHIGWNSAKIFSRLISRTDRRQNV